jgi:hypothetical protein
MAMQPRAWMTSYLFSARISHFFESMGRLGGISLEHRHLLILDGYNSHVMLDVVLEAKRVGLDFLTLPSYTLHVLQPLDITVFKPFKQHFRDYRNFWTSRNLNQLQWMALALRKALSESNIKNGFAATRIFSINKHVVDKYLSLSKTYHQ